MAGIHPIRAVLSLLQQSGDPGAAAAGNLNVYVKNGGIYVEDSSGNVNLVGPLGEGAIAPLVGNYLTSSIATGAGSATTPRNTVTYLPAVVSVPRAFDRIAVSVGTALVGGTTPVVRLGIYADDGTFSKPGTLVLDAGAVPSLTTTGVQAITIAQTLQPGLYWLASQYTDAGAPTTALQLQCQSAGLTLPGSGFAATYRGLQATATAGALPGTAPTPTAPSASTSALVGIRGA